MMKLKNTVTYNQFHKPTSIVEGNIYGETGIVAILVKTSTSTSDHKATQNAAKRDIPIKKPNNFNPDKAWEVLGTKPGYNYYGPDKTGWDPRRIRIDFALEPVPNGLDELAYLHDIAHYSNGTNGGLSSVLSTDRATIVADLALARGSLNLLRSGTLAADVAKVARTTVVGMYALTGIHTMTIYSYYWTLFYNY